MVDNSESSHHEYASGTDEDQGAESSGNGHEDDPDFQMSDSEDSEENSSGGGSESSSTVSSSDSESTDTQSTSGLSRHRHALGIPGVIDPNSIPDIDTELAEQTPTSMASLPMLQRYHNMDFPADAPERVNTSVDPQGNLGSRDVPDPPDADLAPSSAAAIRRMSFDATALESPSVDPSRTATALLNLMHGLGGDVAQDDTLVGESFGPSPGARTHEKCGKQEAPGNTQSPRSTGSSQRMVQKPQNEQRRREQGTKRKRGPDDASHEEIWDVGSPKKKSVVSRLTAKQADKLGLANTLRINSKCEETEKLLEELIEERPKAEIFHRTLIDLYESTGQTEKIEAATLRMYRAVGTTAAIWMSIAEAARNRGDNELYIECLIHVLRGDPTNVKIGWAIAKFWKETGHYMKAARSFQQILNHLPWHPALLIPLADLYHTKMGKTDQAIKLLEDCVEFVKEENKEKKKTSIKFPVAYMLCQLYIFQAKYAQALDVIKHTELLKNPKSELPIELIIAKGICNLHTGHKEEAEGQLEKLTDLDVNKFGNLYLSVACAYIMTKLPEKARKCIEVLIPIEAYNIPDVWFKYGECFHMLKDNKTAKYWLQKVITSDHSDANKHKMDAYISLATCESEDGNKDKCVHVLGKAFNQGPRISEWDSTQVVKWLSGLRLGKDARKYVETFKKESENVTGKELLLVTKNGRDGDWLEKYIGVTNEEHKKTILSAINNELGLAMISETSPEQDRELGSNLQEQQDMDPDDKAFQDLEERDRKEKDNRIKQRREREKREKLMGSRTKDGRPRRKRRRLPKAGSDEVRLGVQVSRGRREKLKLTKDEIMRIKLVRKALKLIASQMEGLFEKKRYSELLKKSTFLIKQLLVSPDPSKILSDTSILELVVNVCQVWTLPQFRDERSILQFFDVVERTRAMNRHMLAEFRPKLDEDLCTKLNFVAAHIFYDQKKYDDAYKQISSVAKNAPHSARTMKFYLKVLVELKYHTRATRSVERMLQNHPDSMALRLLRGHIHMIRRTYVHAAKEYMKTMVRHPNDPVINFYMGIAYLQHSIKRSTLNRHHFVEQAFAFLHRYHDLSNRSMESCYNLARAYHHLGIRHLAIQHYEKVFEDKPRTVAVRAPVSFEVMGLLELVEGETCAELKRLAAINLAAIYSESGSLCLAQSLLSQYSDVNTNLEIPGEDTDMGSGGEELCNEI